MFLITSKHSVVAASISILLADHSATFTPLFITYFLGKYLWKMGNCILLRFIGHWPINSINSLPFKMSKLKLTGKDRQRMTVFVHGNRKYINKSNHGAFIWEHGLSTYFHLVNWHTWSCWDFAELSWRSLSDLVSLLSDKDLMKVMGFWEDKPQTIETFRF